MVDEQRGAPTETEYTGEVAPAPVQTPLFGELDAINQGTIAIETGRAVAEAQGKLMLAKRFPRNEVRAYANMRAACSRKGIAEKAFYNFPRGGQSVTGPTIRFAEELARIWGNIDYGIKELSQDADKSEMQAYAWDMETNTISVQNFTSPHRREVNKKMVALTTDRDIYEINANMGARRLRSRILAILPTDYVDAAIEQCKQTLAGKADEPLIDRVKKLVVAFGKYGVTPELIEKRIGRSLETMTADDFVDFTGIFNALKNGESKVSEWFDSDKKASDITAALKGVNQA